MRHNSTCGNMIIRNDWPGQWTSAGVITCQQHVEAIVLNHKSGDRRGICMRCVDLEMKIDSTWKDRNDVLPLEIVKR